MVLISKKKKHNLKAQAKLHYVIYQIRLIRLEYVNKERETYLPKVLLVECYGSDRLGQTARSPTTEYIGPP